MQNAVRPADTPPPPPYWDGDKTHSTLALLTQVNLAKIILSLYYILTYFEYQT